MIVTGLAGAAAPRSRDRRRLFRSREPDHFREFQNQQRNRPHGEQHKAIGKGQKGRLQEAAQGRVMLAPKLNTNREADDTQQIEI